MSKQPPQDDPRNIWQSQEPTRPTMSAQEFRERLRKLQSKSRRGNFRSVLSGIVVLIIFVSILLRIQSPLERFAFGLFILGTMVAMFPHIVGLWKGSRAASPEPDIAVTTGLDYYRRLLEPQRNYESYTAICVFLIFFGVMLVLVPMVAKQIEDPNSRVSIRAILPFSILAAAWGVSFIWMRRRHERWVRRELELLSTLEKETL